MPLLPALSRLGRDRLQALLAGGIVVGVGAVSTLATWNDSEFYGNTFTGDANFNLQSSTDGGTTWADHTTELTAGSIPFDGDVDAMAPGETVYGAVKFQMSDNSDWPAEVTLEHASSSGPCSLLLLLPGWRAERERHLRPPRDRRPFPSVSLCP